MYQQDELLAIFLGALLMSRLGLDLAAAAVAFTYHHSSPQLLPPQMPPPQMSPPHVKPRRSLLSANVCLCVPSQCLSDICEPNIIYIYTYIHTLGPFRVLLLRMYVVYAVHAIGSSYMREVRRCVVVS